MEAAHLNLHQNENLYGHGCKTFRGSHTTWSKPNVLQRLQKSQAPKKYCTVGFLFGRVQWNNKLYFKHENVQCILCCIIHYSLIATGVLHFLVFVSWIKMTWAAHQCTRACLVETNLWLVDPDHLLAIWLLTSKVKLEPCSISYTDLKIA